MIFLEQILGCKSKSLLFWRQLQVPLSKACVQSKEYSSLQKIMYFLQGLTESSLYGCTAKFVLQRSISQEVMGPNGNLNLPVSNIQISHVESVSYIAKKVCICDLWAKLLFPCLSILIRIGRIRTPRSGMKGTIGIKIHRKTFNFIYPFLLNVLGRVFFLIVIIKLAWESRRELYTPLESK